MAKILETKLPVAIGEISPETFNRLVRVLELSLNKVDIDSTLSVNETQRNENQFQKGDIIWNLSTDQLWLLLERFLSQQTDQLRYQYYEHR